jgi:hypothetical protein
MKCLCGRGELFWGAALVLGTGLAAAPTAIAGAQYSATILADSPLGYWRLGEPDPGMPAADATPNGNNGTYLGGVALGQAGAILGDTDTAAAFDGSSAFVDIPSTSGGTFDLNANFSLEAWVINNGQDPTIHLGRILSNGGIGLQGYGWGILPNDSVRFTTWGILDFDSSQTVVPRDGAWHYVALTFDDTATANFYLDGQLTETKVDSQARLARSSNFHLIIGDTGPGTGLQEYYNGSIDEVAIYSYVLTADQIAAHFQAAQ